MRKPLEVVIAEALRIEPTRVSDALAFNAIPQWDSFAHVELMLALEANYSVTIDEQQMIDLICVGDIRSFLTQHGY